MINGLINIYKEPGFTSHDVVAKPGNCKNRRKSATGTLDPDGEGVLPVCLGKATKLCDMLAGETKTYEAVLLLGVTTDTQDAGGIIREKSSGVLHRGRSAQMCGSLSGGTASGPSHVFGPETEW